MAAVQVAVLLKQPLGRTGEGAASWGGEAR